MKDKADFFIIISLTALFQLWGRGWFSSLFILSLSPPPWWLAMVFSLSWSGGFLRPAMRPRGEWHSYAWSFTPRRFFFCLFFFCEFTQSSSAERRGRIPDSSAPLCPFSAKIWRDRELWETGRNDTAWVLRSLRFVCKKVSAPLLQPSTHPWMFVIFRKLFLGILDGFKHFCVGRVWNCFGFRMYAVISLCSSVKEANPQTFWVVRLLTLFVLKSCRNQNSSWKCLFCLTSVEMLVLWQKCTGEMFGSVYV